MGRDGPLNGRHDGHHQRVGIGVHPHPGPVLMVAIVLRWSPDLFHFLLVCCMMEIENIEEITAAALCLATSFNYYVNVINRKVIKKKWRKRRWWMVSIHRNRSRQIMEKQIAELLKEPSGEFDNFVRMTFTDFEYLLQQISPRITKQNTMWRESIPAKIRLAVTLRFLATGDSYRSLHYIFKISSQIISKIIPEVCLALNDTLKDLIKIPNTTEEWLLKANRFQFPHCLGAIDGKHISIRQPAHSASEYYNYKGGFSIVLLGLVDHDYCFMYAEVGSPGRISDGGVLNQSILWEKISKNRINLPAPSSLPDSDVNLPYVFLGDGAFALSNHIMKPFPGHHALGSSERKFNQELSRSRVVVENSFGILTNVFRVFQRAIPLDVIKASIITKTCVLLHNFLRKSKTSRHIYSPYGSCDTCVNGELVRAGNWRTTNGSANLLQIQRLGRRCGESATKTRENFMKYICNKRNEV